MIITDADLNVVAQSEVYVVHQNDEVLNGMDAWNTATHGRTVQQRVRDSRLTEAEVELYGRFISAWIPEKTSPMCGNTIHQDRRFMVHCNTRWSLFCYPQSGCLHFKELARRWHPAVAKGVVKRGSHQALDDILESIRRDALLPRQHKLPAETA